MGSPASSRRRSPGRRPRPIPGGGRRKPSRGESCYHPNSRAATRGQHGASHFCRGGSFHSSHPGRPRHAHPVLRLHLPFHPALPAGTAASPHGRRDPGLVRWGFERPVGGGGCGDPPDAADRCRTHGCRAFPFDPAVGSGPGGRRSRGGPGPGHLGCQCADYGRQLGIRG